MSEAKTHIRILLADDHYLVRAGLKTVLGSDPRVAVVAEADDGAQAIEQYRKHQPDLVLMDLRMPVMSGIEATACICREFPAARIIMLTTFDGDEDIHRALQAGARSYLPKNMPVRELLTALRRVHEGDRFLPQAMAGRLAERIPGADLTAKETEVLTLIGKGFSNREIGDVLGVSENTIKTQVKSVLAKLDVTDRTEAVTVALERGILHLE